MRKIKFEYRITIIYLIIGGAWIIFSDKFLLTITGDHEQLTQLQTYKGWFYVAATSALLFFLVKNHLKRLRKAEVEAQKSNELKTSFLQNISHEIRTPMNSIVGFSDILNDNHLDEKQVKKFLAIIRNSSNQLLYIVNELLDISMLDTGNVKVYENTVHLNNFLDEINGAFSPLLKDSIKFEVQTSLSEPDCIISTDEGKLRLVIMNLLNNANKYTESGSIKLAYELNHSMLKFTVTDTGMGIQKQKQESLFMRFEKAHDERTNNYDGVGLGLAICKGNIELMGGKIGVSSQPDKGSVFYFSIPYSPVS